MKLLLTLYYTHYSFMKEHPCAIVGALNSKDTRYMPNDAKIFHEMEIEVPDVSDNNFKHFVHCAKLNQADLEIGNAQHKLDEAVEHKQSLLALTHQPEE